MTTDYSIISISFSLLGDIYQSLYYSIILNFFVIYFNTKKTLGPI